MAVISQHSFFFAILIVLLIPPTKFHNSLTTKLPGLAIVTVLKEMPFGEFQDGCHSGHLGCHNLVILAILVVLLVPYTKFQHNLTTTVAIYSSKGDVI